jgi:hypothetical protein
MNKRALYGALFGLIVAAPAVADRDANIRQFEVTLRSRGDNSGASPEVLQATVARLMASGTDEREGVDAVMEVLTSKLNPRSTDEIVYLSRDIAAARRGNLVVWTHNLVRAVEGGTNRLIDFVYGLNPNGMSVDEATEMRRLADAGDRAAAAAKGISVLQRQFGGSYDALRRKQ